MSIEAKKQHYIWEFYLKGWATDDQIWCKRGNEPFLTSTENVGQQRYFYELEALSEAEVELLTRMVMSGSPINQFVNLTSLNAYLSIANSGGKWARFGLEQYYGMIEVNALPVLENLREGNFAILNDKQSKIHLCIYLGHQYTRTKKIRSSLATIPLHLDIPDKYQDCDLRKVQGAMSFIISNSIGASICDHLDLRVIENNSDVRLITCDQPIYNLLAIPGDLSKESSIYFPISPNLALWAKKGPNDENIETDEKARELNLFMVRNSLESIFALHKEDLTISFD
ncbi:DUF4238 domain-containing protein [Burkholderia gladioli]|uniref:DUF4238 domain-containing protein n=1 Tax=Burkholderia gladioli TaxID=28095 RepID=UPI00163DEA6F|nr:DUF4238 domain-containing protein [Burkholderia gladioli]